MLVTWLAAFLTNLLPRSLFIGMMTCLYDRHLVVIFSLGLGLSFILLMIFWTESIFLLERFGKTFLIFNVFIAIFLELSLRLELEAKA